MICGGRGFWNGGWRGRIGRISRGRAFFGRDGRLWRQSRGGGSIQDLLGDVAKG